MKLITINLWAMSANYYNYNTLSFFIADRIDTKLIYNFYEKHT